MNELISVIIPIYKVEEYLQRCVDSVLKQTFKSLEIILVDDGSPDRCGEICDKYAALDNRVKVIHKKNGGLSDARNAGIEICRGDYIAFIDSDDWVHDKYFEKLYQLLKKTNSDIAVCNFISTATHNIQVDRSKEEIYEYFNIDALGQFTDRFYVQMVIACGKLYKRNLFNGIKFPIGRLHEDEFTTYKLIFNAKKIVLTTAQLYYYWQREDSIMGSRFNIKSRLDAIDAFKERAEFFQESGLHELSNDTYKILFFEYLLLNRRIHEFEDVIYKKEYNVNFKNLKNSLRKSKQKFSFRMFYELYYILPKTIDLIYRIYLKLREP